MRNKKGSKPSKGKATLVPKPGAKPAKGTSRKKPKPGEEITPLNTASEAPRPVDLAKINSLKEKKVPLQFTDIVLSETWYEFSAFLIKFNICRNTAKKWMKRRWLAYTQVGKMVFFNKADLEAFMLRFRRPPLMWIGWLTVLVNSVEVPAFC